MQKKSLIALLICASLATAGCGQNKPVQTEAQPKTETTTESLVKEIGVKEFKEKIMDYEKNPTVWKYQGERPAVIDFYATWCGPCKAMAPLVEAKAEQYAGKVDFYKVDIDKSKELAMLFRIQQIPTLIFIPVQGTPQMRIGMMSSEDLGTVINEIQKQP